MEINFVGGGTVKNFFEKYYAKYKNQRERKKYLFRIIFEEVLKFLNGN